MTTTTETGEPPHWCTKCHEPFDLEDDDDLLDILEHWLKVHSDSPEFWDVVDGAETLVVCRQCHSAFESEVQAQRQGMAMSAITFSVRTFCDSCEADRENFDSLPSRVWRHVKPDDLLKSVGVHHA